MLPYMLLRNKGGLIPWYLKGGVAKSNCLAAYQALGAADLATSFINLANPGTYDLTGGVDPDFDIEKGWTFDGATQYKITGIDPDPNATQNWSAIMRFSNVVANTGLAFGATNGEGLYFSIAPNRSTYRRYYQPGVNNGGAAAESGVIAVAGLYGYYNGVADTGILTWADCNIPNFFIGGINFGGSLYLPFSGIIEAIAFYNTVLTATQVLAISNAMAALPDPFDPGDLWYPSPARANTGEFMIAIGTDFHVGSWVLKQEIDPMLHFIENAKVRLNLKAFFFAGDMSYIDPGMTEFIAALPNLADVAHLFAIGNHEYDGNDCASRLTINWHTIFPQSYYTSKSWWSGGFYEADHTENAYLLMTIDSVDYIFITFEFFPRDAVLTWLDGLLTTYAARRAIIITHAYEYTDGSLYADDDPFGPLDYFDPADDFNSGESIWSTVINNHDNVIFIQSGHVGMAARHVANSAGGQPVNQLVADYQGDYGPIRYYNTSIRFYVFNPTTETIRAQTFSPITRTFLTDASNQFSLTY
jgi:hypothetical protein